MEGYPIPREFVGLELGDGYKLPKNLRPIFRDRDELSGSSNLGPAIEQALKKSRYLIVLCSPNSAKSEWVDKEIATFQGMGRGKKVLALILDGEPNSGDVGSECFPPSLRYPCEPLAGDLRKEGDGKERGFLKVVSGIAELDFDVLYRRHERQARRRRIIASVIAIAVMTGLGCLSAFAFAQKMLAERRESEAMAARMEAEKQELLAKERLAENYVEQGRRWFLADETVRAAALLNEARKIKKDVSGVDMLLGELWFSMSDEVARVRGNRVAVGQLFFVGDGNELVWSDVHGHVRGFEPEVRKLRRMSEPSDVNHLRQFEMVSRDGKRFADFRKQAAGEKGKVLLRELVVGNFETEEEFRIAWPDDFFHPTMLVLSPQGRKVLVAGGRGGEEESVYLWEVGTDEFIRVEMKEEASRNNTQWYFSSEEEHLVEITWKDQKQTMHVRSAQTGMIKEEIELGGELHDFSYARGRQIAVTRNHIFLGFKTGEVVCHEFGRREMKGEGPAEVDEAFSIGVEQILATDDGALVLCVGNKEAVLYRRESWEVLWRCTGIETNGSIYGAAMSSNGKRVMVVCDSRILVHDLDGNQTGEMAACLDRDRVKAAISEDGELMAVGKVSGEVMVKRISMGQPRLLWCLPDSHVSYFDYVEMEAGKYLTNGSEPYFLEPVSGVSRRAENGYAEVADVSEDGSLFFRGHPGLNFDVRRLGEADGIHGFGKGEMNLFLRGKEAAGLVVNNEGEFHLYDNSPEYLGEAVDCKDAEGNLAGLLQEKHGERVLAVFSNGAFVITSVDGKKLGPFAVHWPDGKSERLPRLLEFRDGLVLYARDQNLLLYDVNKGNRIELPEMEFQAASIISQSRVLTVNVFGQLSCWGVDGKLIASTQPLSQSSESSIFSVTDAKAGSTLLIDEDEKLVFSTYGNRIYVWSLPEMELLWRSGYIDLTAFSFSEERMKLWEFDSKSSSIVFSSERDNLRGYSSLISIALPKEVPSIDEVSAYLRDVAWMKLSDGRLIPTDDEE